VWVIVPRAPAASNQLLVAVDKTGVEKGTAAQGKATSLTSCSEAVTVLAYALPKDKPCYLLAIAHGPSYDK
jgi:hypothetical protein